MGAIIHNSNIIKRLIDEAKIQVSVDKVPDQLAEKILAVLNVNPPKNIKLSQATASDTTSTTLLTCSSTKKTFMTNLNLSLAKDDISDATYVRITLQAENQAGRSAFYLRFEPLTAASNLTQNLNFPFPIELKKGSEVLITIDSATASIDASGLIYYYEVEDN